MSNETCQTPAEISKTSLFDPCTPSMRHETVRRHDPQSRHSSPIASICLRLVSATGPGLQVTESPWPSDSESDVDSTAAVRPRADSAALGPRPGRSGSEPRLPSEPECAGAAPADSESVTDRARHESGSVIARPGAAAPGGRRLADTVTHWRAAVTVTPGPGASDRGTRAGPTLARDWQTRTGPAARYSQSVPSSPVLS